MNWIGLIGLMFRFYDLFFIKEFLSYGSIAAYRLYGNTNETTVIGIVSSFLYPFSIIALVFSFHVNGIKLKDKLLIFVNTFLFIVYIYLLGGRTSLSLLAGMVLISFIIKRKKLSLVFNLKRILLIISIFLLFFIYSSIILINRLEEMGFTIYDHLNYMQNERHFIVKGWFADIHSDNILVNSLKYTFISLVHYLLHGYYQFFLLFEYFDINNLGFGAYQFYPIFKLGNFIGFDTPDFDKLMGNLETQGVYTTFFGPVYTDFGFGSLTFLFMFIFGFICQLSYKKAINGNLSNILIYSYLGTVLMHSSFINMIQSGMGLYVFVSMLLSVLLLKFL
ncbi:oligosaccharide repeat unit polymerase [Anoxybacillus sp. LAT_38]|nr:oligosaccharide repeat unit polymerase [Anoxybacillus sp. LAT_38]